MKWGIEPRQEQPLTASDMPGGTPGFDMTKHEKEAAETYMKTAREYLDGDQPAVFDFVVQVATDPSHSIEVGDEPGAKTTAPIDRSAHSPYHHSGPRSQPSLIPTKIPWSLIRGTN